MIDSVDPVGLPGLAAMSVGFLAFLLALMAALRRTRAEAGGGATRSRASAVGIVVQGAGIVVVGLGPIDAALDPLGAKALIEAAAVALLMAAAVWLFVWATRTMGRDWSLVARTRHDHRLVDTGPFAFVRHPIYVALFLLMVALAIAYGHTRQLAGGIPLFAIGTWLRTREEERLLRARFGAAYDAYARRVRRFVPGLF